MTLKWALALSLLLYVERSSPAVETLTPDYVYDLGRAGEVTHWLMLGYLPGTGNESAPFESAGGEAGLKGVGGMSETILLDQAGATTNLVWRLARMTEPESIGIWSRFQRLNLFRSERGSFPGTAYLYCRLDSPTALQASFLVGVDDRARIWVNGRAVFESDGSRLIGQEDAGEAPLQLNKGVNHVLVRIVNTAADGLLSLRLVDRGGAPPKSVKIRLPATIDTPLLPGIIVPPTPWAKVIESIQPVMPPAHREFMGARLAHTMALLESGAQSGRPVRILFYGQSIEGEWTSLLISALRERYPGTRIVSENRAIGGWGVPRLVKTLKHDILRARPDLVSFHAYQGTPRQWEQLLSDLRRETTADIITRSDHLGASGLPDRVPTGEEIMLRSLAAKYDVEMVDLRQEWIDYLESHRLKPPDLLRDCIHLNRRGNVLMAALYERHFRLQACGQAAWADRVRRHALPSSMKLTFIGNRIDLVMPPCSGGARVLIDGQTPSALNLFHGTRPYAKTREMYGDLPVDLLTYTTGPDMREETWQLTITHCSTDRRTVRYTLAGSETGPDGEGRSDAEFVSGSGRIRISPGDFVSNGTPTQAPTSGPVFEALARPPLLTWSIVPDGLDRVHGMADTGKDAAAGTHSTYTTLADGLSNGRHELTLIPLGDGPFSVHSVEVHCPPLRGLRDSR